jgi:hypothetical protein
VNFPKWAIFVAWRTAYRKNEQFLGEGAVREALKIRESLSASTCVSGELLNSRRLRVGDACRFPNGVGLNRLRSCNVFF